MLTFEKILSDEQIKNTALLADQIWHQHFIGIIPEGQIDYMIEKFQSYRAIKAQLSDGYEYYGFLLTEYRQATSGSAKSQTIRCFYQSCI